MGLGMRVWWEVEEGVGGKENREWWVGNGNGWVGSRGEGNGREAKGWEWSGG